MIKSMKPLLLVFLLALALVVLTACDPKFTLQETPTEPTDPDSTPLPDPTPEAEVITIVFGAHYNDGAISVQVPQHRDKVLTWSTELYDSEQRRLASSVQPEPIFSLAAPLPTPADWCQTFTVRMSVALKPGYELTQAPAPVPVHVSDAEPLCQIPDPVAAFDVFPEACVVEFLNTSSGGSLEFSWTFGDGSLTSEDQHPTHAYSGPGSYDVTLTATDADTGVKDSVVVRVLVASDCVSVSDGG